MLEASGAGGGAVPGDLAYLGWNPAKRYGVNCAGTARDANSCSRYRGDDQPDQPRHRPAGRLHARSDRHQFRCTHQSDLRQQHRARFPASWAIFVAALNDIVSAGEIRLPPRSAASWAMIRRAREFAPRSGSARRADSFMPGAGVGEPRTLADLGLALNRDGTFRLDTARLNQALETSPDAVRGDVHHRAFGRVRHRRSSSRAKTASPADPGSLGGSVAAVSRRSSNAAMIRLTRIAEQQGVPARTPGPANTWSRPNAGLRPPPRNRP